MSQDFSHDQIGKRLSGEGLSKHEMTLAADDRERVSWILRQLPDTSGLVLDIGASDGAISLLMRALGHRVFAFEKHPQHGTPPPGVWWWHGDALDGLAVLPDFPVYHLALCGEIFEHMTPDDGKRILDRLVDFTDRIVVTVPNRNSVTFDVTGRHRWDWPDHVRYFTQSDFPLWLEANHWQVTALDPIVGTLDDSIWLGAVCRRA